MIVNAGGKYSLGNLQQKAEEVPATGLQEDPDSRG
jgi:hypothetical protein